MKTKILFVFSFFVLTICICIGQVPKGFNYQAIARDNNHEVIANKLLPVRIALHASSPTGTLLWQEDHPTITSNQFGLISLVVGNGTKSGGSATNFSDIDWNAQTVYLKTSIQYPGSSYVEMGTAQLWSVPYSLVADKANGVNEGKNLLVVSENDLGTEALFEVRRKDGQTVFAVYPDAVNVYVPRSGGKGAKGGFAVGGFDESKANPQDYFRVTPDSVRIYIDPTPVEGKGAKGGFAVGGYGESKGINDMYFNLTGALNVNTVVASPQILWYPNKNAFLAGNVHIGHVDSVGDYSTALGYQSIAMGDYSQAFGYRAKAFGDYSTSIGKNSIAGSKTTAANNAFAFGDRAKATGNDSYAFGSNAEATGPYSVAIGYGSKATINYAHSFGLYSTASGTGSLALGYYGTAVGSYSAAVGRSANAQGSSSIAAGYGATTGVDAIGAAAIGRSATANGQYSIAAGQGATTGANATGAAALGRNAAANGLYSTSIGYAATATGSYSVAIGASAAAQSDYSYAFGASASASNTYAYAFGKSAVATGNSSISIGNSSQASNTNSVSIGNSSISSGVNATSIGYQSQANGELSTALGSYYSYTFSLLPYFTGGKGDPPEGESKGDFIIRPPIITPLFKQITFNRANIANGKYSISIGNGNLSNNGGIAVGSNNDATAFGAVALGVSNNATNTNTFAAGYNNLATGYYATAFGNNTYSKAYGSFVIGQYNEITGDSTKWVSTDPLFVVGNGLNITNRSNAVIVYKNGRSIFTGEHANVSLNDKATRYMYVPGVGFTTTRSVYGVKSYVNREDTDVDYYYSGYFYDIGSAGTYQGLYADVRTGGSVDVAEYIFDSKGNTEPADVIVADPAKKESVVLSSQPYQASVLGVVSTEPHLTMGMELVTDEKTGEPLSGVKAARLALNGRVPVKVTGENGPIVPGDMVTTSSIQGHAMKWSLLDVTKAKDFEEMKMILAENEKRRNAIIGKAVESFSGTGTGKIMVLISLQ
jgi:hypothetical protein